jgi:tight adherence protein B
MQGLFPLLVFLVVTALVLLVLLLFGADAGRRVRERVAGITQRPAGEEEPRSLLREQYLRQLSPLEQWIEALPGMRRLETLCEQTGRHLPAYRVLLLSLALAAGAALVLLAFGRPWLALLAFIGVLPLPYLKLVRDRNLRVGLFEEQLPDALEVMSRALRAGNPFNETLRVVAEEMDDPIATEFGITFSDLNYGVSVKAAFKGLLERTPNVSLAALVTAVLVQRETGGNMAEILDRIAGVLRQRQRFQRRVRTLTAEGRVSAWILVLMPFVLAIMLSLVAPSYLPMLLEHPVGLRLIGIALAVMAFGIWWVRRIVRVRY